MTTDLGSGPGLSQAAIIPTPSRLSGRRAISAPAGRHPAGQHDAQPSQSAGQISLASAASGRVTVRSALYAALAGVRLCARDRQFLTRLVAWDKRNAASVASLLSRTRQAGRDEAALTPRQLEVVLAALSDAAAYRISGSAVSGCWDCQLVPGGRCGEHLKDHERARGYAELAATLPGVAVTGPVVASKARPAVNPDDLPRKMTGYRQRTSVAS